MYTHYNALYPLPELSLIHICTTAEVPVWKIDAETGEIIWQTSYDCSSEDSVSGGVQSTIAVGKAELSDNIYVTVARTGGQAQGVLACIDKNTGKVNCHINVIRQFFFSNSDGRLYTCLLYTSSMPSQ